jgi:hypothetical protein
MSSEKKTPLSESIVTSQCGAAQIRLVQDAGGKWRVYSNGVEVDEAQSLGDAMAAAEELYGLPIQNWKRAAAI